MLLAVLATFNDKLLVTDCILTTSKVLFSEEQEKAFLVLAPSFKSECDEFPPGVRITVEFGSGVVISRVITNFSFAQDFQVEFSCPNCGAVANDKTALLTIETQTRVTQSPVGVLISLRASQSACVAEAELSVFRAKACFQGRFNGNCMNTSGQAISRAYLRVMNAEYSEMVSQSLDEHEFQACFAATLYQSQDLFEASEVEFVVDAAGVETVFRASSLKVTFEEQDFVAMSDLVFYASQLSVKVVGDLTTPCPGGIGVFVSAVSGDAQIHTLSTMTTQAQYQRSRMIISCRECDESLGAIIGAETIQSVLLELRFYSEQGQILNRTRQTYDTVRITNWVSAVVKEVGDHTFRVQLQDKAPRDVSAYRIGFFGFSSQEEYLDYDYEMIDLQNCVSDTVYEFTTQQNIAALFGASVVLTEGLEIVDQIQFTAKMIQVNGLAEFWTLNAATMGVCAVSGPCIYFLCMFVVLRCKVRLAARAPNRACIVDEM